jgi:hypothetical protein
MLTNVGFKGGRYKLKTSGLFPDPNSSSAPDLTLVSTCSGVSRPLDGIVLHCRLIPSRLDWHPFRIGV